MGHFILLTLGLNVMRYSKGILPRSQEDFSILFGICRAIIEEILVKLEEITIHCSNLQKLKIKIYECTNYISQAVSPELLITEEINYNLRIKNLIQMPKVKTSSSGQCSLSFRGSILWDTLSDSIKSAQNIIEFIK